ncbi:protein-L-isoaspartate(D-aspartate) O-methyltransferase [Elusimicrobiota bacterium]
MPKRKEIPEENWDKIRSQAITKQIMGRGIADERVLNAFQEIPRHLILPPQIPKELAYADRPLPIGYGQTISQPYIVAYMTEKLDLQGNELVLEVGTGSGYQTAILSKLAKEVLSVELIPELAEMARINLKRLKISNAELKIGDGNEGWMENAPYDRIIITACVSDIPKSLMAQLNAPGKLIAPVGNDNRQKLILYEKKPNPPNPPILDIRELLPVMFVPMRTKADLEKMVAKEEE